METQNEKTHNKRQRTNELDTEKDIDFESDYWPRILIISSATDEPLKISPFAIQKGIEGIGGKPVDIKRLRSGDIVVHVEKKAHAINLLRTTRFAQHTVKCTPHRTLNSSKGILRCRDLEHDSDDYILNCLKSQGVVHVKRFNTKINGVIKKTNTFLLTFNTPTLPKDIKVGYMNCEISKYVPNPMRCFKCQRYGHTESRCKQELTCGKCGQMGHAFNDCAEEAKCVHCAGNHPAGFKGCPRWKEEKEILTIKANCGVSFPEAKRQYAETKKSLSHQQTYSQVVKAIPTKTVETQTDMTWIKGDKSMTVPSLNNSKEIVPSALNQKDTKTSSTQASSQTNVNIKTYSSDNTGKSDQAKKAKANSQRMPKAEKPLEHSDNPIRDLDKKETKGKTSVKLKRNNSRNKKDKKHQNQDNQFSALESDMDVANSESD